MNGLQLWHALSMNASTRPSFDGVFASDTLRTLQHQPKLIICNTDPSYKPGEHWLLFYVTDNGTVEMFDSLGKDITDYSQDIVHFTERFGQVSKVLTQRVQPLNSALCGQYCLYFAYLRCKGLSMESIATDMPSATFIQSYVTYLYDIPDVFPDYQSCTNC